SAVGARPGQEMAARRPVWGFAMMAEGGAGWIASRRVLRCAQDDGGLGAGRVPRDDIAAHVCGSRGVQPPQVVPYRYVCPVQMRSLRRVFPDIALRAMGGHGVRPYGRVEGCWCLRFV